MHKEHHKEGGRHHKEGEEYAEKHYKKKGTTADTKTNNYLEKV